MPRRDRSATGAPFNTRCKLSVLPSFYLTELDASETIRPFECDRAGGWVVKRNNDAIELRGGTDNGAVDGEWGRGAEPPRRNLLPRQRPFLSHGDLVGRDNGVRMHVARRPYFGGGVVRRQRQRR